MPRRGITPCSQIIFRETDDGRVECAVIHRGQGLPLALARMLVAALGSVADVRDLGQQLSEGETQAVSLLTIRDITTQSAPLPLCTTCHGCGYPLEITADLTEGATYGRCNMVGCDRREDRCCEEGRKWAPSPFQGPCPDAGKVCHHLTSEGLALGTVH